MPTLLICPDCGGVRGATEATEAGAPCTCANPSPSTTIYGAEAGSKICCICGTDVNGKKRMKDHEGRYFCYDCGTADNQRKKQVAATPGTSCAECQKPMPKDKLTDVAGELLCDRCRVERQLRRKREQARIAYAARDAQDQNRQIKLAVGVAIGVLILFAAAWYFFF